MAPSFLSWAKALSTSLRSSPERAATIPVLCRDVPEGTVPFDVVGIEVFSLASPEEAALPADGAVAETLELFTDEFKSLLPC